MEATVGIEPTIRVLQTRALPLGYVARKPFYPTVYPTAMISNVTKHASLRRTPGSGSLRQRPDGRWELRVFDGVRQRSFYGATKADALAGPQRIVNREHRKAATVTNASVETFFRQWLDATRQTVKPATWRKYDSAIRLHALPTLGRLRLTDVRPDHLTALYADLARHGLGGTSVHHVHVILGTGFEAAMTQGLLASNPSRRVKAPRVNEKSWTILSREDAARLLRAARGDRLEALYALALTTGMREGELLALRWRDIDIDRATLSVRGTVVKSLAGKYVIGSPKTGAARRTVSLGASAVSSLCAARAAAVVRAVATADDVRDAFIFPAERGGIMAGGNLVNRHFHPLLIRAGLPSMRFHDLRHTAITHMLEDGVNAVTVSRVVGHASVAVTLGQYGHVTTGMQAAAVAAMDLRYPAA